MLESQENWTLIFRHDVLSSDLASASDESAMIRLRAKMIHNWRIKKSRRAQSDFVFCFCLIERANVRGWLRNVAQSHSAIRHRWISQFAIRNDRLIEAFSVALELADATHSTGQIDNSED